MKKKIQEGFDSNDDAIVYYYEDGGNSGVGKVISEPRRFGSLKHILPNFNTPSTPPHLKILDIKPYMPKIDHNYDSYTQIKKLRTNETFDVKSIVFGANATNMIEDYLGEEHENRFKHELLELLKILIANPDYNMEVQGNVGSYAPSRIDEKGRVETLTNSGLRILREKRTREELMQLRALFVVNMMLKLVKELKLNINTSRIKATTGKKDYSIGVTIKFVKRAN